MGVDSNDSGLISGINVTPFVDVVLVLLVIFIVAAPLVFKDSFNVKLPGASTADTRVPQSLGVAVTRDGQVLLNGAPTTKEGIASAVKEALAKDPKANAIIAGDTDAKHGDIVKAIDWLRSGGLSNFAFQIERQ